MLNAYSMSSKFKSSVRCLMLVISLLWCQASTANLLCLTITEDELPVAATNAPTVADFPPELKINEDFLHFLETQLPAEQMQTLVRILKASQTLGASLPLNLRRSITLATDSLILPLEEQRLPHFDINNLPLVRTYTVLKAMTNETTLTDAELQTWALMLATYVPAEYPKSLTLTLANFDPLVGKRLEKALSEERHRQTLAWPLSKGLDMGVSLASIGEESTAPWFLQPRAGVDAVSAKRVDGILKKIEQKQNLALRDLRELHTLTMRLFLASVGYQATSIIVHPTKSYTIEVVPLLANLLERLKPYAVDKLNLVNSLTLFEYFYLGMPLAKNYSQFHNEFLKLIEAQYLAEPRRLFAQQQNDLRLQQQAAEQAAQAARLKALRNDPDVRFRTLRPVTVPAQPTPSTSKVKTRGVANPAMSVTNEPAAQTEVENRLETLIEMPELALHLIAEETPYKVRFQRLQNEYPTDQTFIFSKKVIDWFMEHPSETLDFFEAIRSGPVTSAGQSGIKMLIHEVGHPYEAKIQGTGMQWRMTLERNGNTWYGVRVTHRDHM